MSQEPTTSDSAPEPVSPALKKGRAPARKPETAKLKAKAQKKATSESHPGNAAMILEAVTKMAEKKGASLQIIKKYIADTHDVDMTKQGIYIKKALTKLVESGKLTQISGTGASGSFKLTSKSKPEKEPNKTVTASSLKKKATPAEKPAVKKAAPKPRKESTAAKNDKEKAVAEKKKGAPKKAAQRKSARK